MLDAVQLIGDVSSAHVHLKVQTQHMTIPTRTLKMHKRETTQCEATDLQGCHADNLIGVVEEIGQNIKNGGFRENEFLHK